MSGHAAQPERIVVVLPAQELLVVVDLLRNPHFVANRAEFLRAMERLEEGLFVEVRLGLDQLVVEPLQDRVIAGGKRIVNGLVDGVAAVSRPVIDVGHGMADGAGDAGLGGRMGDEVVILTVKLAAEEGDRIVAAGTPARRARPHALAE